MADKSRAGRPEGGDIPQNVHLNATKKIQINHEYTEPKIRLAEPTNEPRKYYCCMCGKGYTTQKGNFLNGGKSLLWRGNGGYLPFCKSCCEIMMESLTSFYSGNEEHALRHLCAMFDWHYDEGASAMTLSQVHMTKTRVGIYPSKLGMRNVAQRGQTYLDTLRLDYEDDQLVTEADEVIEDEDDFDFVITREMIRDWGKGFTREEYDFLQNEFQDWTSRNVCNTKAQEELFRNIALAQLDIRRARERGGKVAEAQKALQDLMNSANILPKQTVDNILAETQSFGTLLKKYEETSPVPEPDDEWKDVDGIRKYMNTWFRGGLAKALKITNENTVLYDEAVEEMERYTVRPASASDREANDASIFDNQGGESNE